MFKLNKSLAIISIFLVSLFLISAASAADNASDVEIVSEIEDADVISVDNDAEAVSTDVAENEEVVADGNSTSSFDYKSLMNMTGGNGTGFNMSSFTNMTGGNGTGFNMSSFTNMTGGNGTGFDMGSMMDMFGGSQATINSTDMTKYYTQTTTFKVTVMNGNKTVTSGNVIFTIDNKDYVGSIGSNGVASVKIKNLKPGEHKIFSQYDKTTAKNTITIKKAIITKNVSVKSKKGGKFTVKILNSKGKVYAKQAVKVKFKGKTYNLKTNAKGIATLKIAKNLKAGKYTVKTTYKGLTVSNKVTIKK